MKAAVERNGRRGQIRFDERRLSFFVYVRCSFYSAKLCWVPNREVRSSKPRRTEPFGTNSHIYSHIYDVGRGYSAFLTRLLQTKRLCLSKLVVYLSLTRWRSKGFRAYVRLATGR